MNVKSFTEIKEFDETNERYVTGYPALAGNVDRGNDVLEKGAFTRTLAENGNEFKWFWSHERDKPPIATIVDIEIVSQENLPTQVKELSPDITEGIKVTRAYLDTERGNEILAGVKSGALNQMSFGYDIDSYDYRNKEGELIKNGSVDAFNKDVRRHLKQIRLWEFSDVNWGMNPFTTNIKAIDVSLPLYPYPYKWDQYAATNRLMDKSGDKYFLANIPLADVIDGETYLIKEAVDNALQWAVIEDNKEALRILEKLYKDYKLTSPLSIQPFLSKSVDVLHTYIEDIKAGRVLSTSNINLITQAITALQKLLKNSGYDMTNEDEVIMKTLFGLQLQAKESEMSNFDELKARLELAKRRVL